MLRGIFLCRPQEIHWFLYQIRFMQPEAWRTFAEYLPASERGDLLAGYHRRLIDPDPAVHMPAAHRMEPLRRLVLDLGVPHRVAAA